MQTTQPRRRPPTISTPTPAAHDTTLVDDMDALLDEIDSVLEEEDTFLLGYRQRGGQ
jgi:ubiquitin-like protein Pup